MVCPACPVIAGSVLMYAFGGAGIAVVGGIKVAGAVVGFSAVSYGAYNYIHGYEYLPQTPGDLDSDSKISQFKGDACIEGSRTSNLLKSTEADNNHFNG